MSTRDETAAPHMSARPRWSASQASALARCVAPVEATEFLDRYWERQPLVVSRTEEGRYDDLLAPGDVERLICSGGLRFPGFRLVKAGGQIPLAEYATDVPWRPAAFTGTADAGRVAAAFADGATIVLQGLHHTWPPLAEFCRALERELEQPVQANAYHTPARSQGFGVHHDTHDVFCLQVAGEKRWLVYEPLLELPLKEQRYSSDLGHAGKPVQDLTLRAGDMLYLPRGWLHEALTSEDDSLHITVGVNVYTRLEALRAGVEALADEVEARRSLAGDGGLPEELFDLLRERLAPNEVAQRRRRRFVDTRRPVQPAQLTEVRTEVDPDVPVERRPTVIAELDGTTLVFEGKQVSFPERVRAELEALAEADGPVRPADLPGSLDEPGRLVLVRRLIREGFLRRSAVDA